MDTGYGSGSAVALPRDESPMPNSTPAVKKHTRGFQACQNCRKRKTGCVLGDDVDNPGPPPCNRCRREGKVCTFAPTRKKRATSTDSSHLTERDPTYGSESGFQNTTGGLHGQPANYSLSPTTDSPNQRPANTTHPAFTPGLTPAFAASKGNTSHPSSHLHHKMPHHTQGMAQPSDGSARSAGKSSVFSDLAARALVTDAPTTQENLGMLTAAAAAIAKRDEQSDNSFRSPSSFNSPSSNGGRRGTFGNEVPSGIDGRLNGLSAADTSYNVDYAHAHKAWSSMRFVRAGWFTESEAINYIEYWRLHLSQMSPVSPPAELFTLAKHEKLLTDEPVLAITILMISSRHMRLTGPAAVTRSAKIHDILWDYLRCLIERLLWGQEQFGGGFCAAGNVKIRESPEGQLTWKGSLRTLSTVEALLLLTDWNPRALFFPPGDDENRLLDTNYNSLTDGNSAIDDQEESDARQSRPYGAWLEPAWRSDRMSWMLLGLAQALSFELGVFDLKQADHASDSSYIRKRRVRRMVLVYVSQTSGRLGLPSMLPLPQWSDDNIFQETNHAQAQDTVDIMQSCWTQIAMIMQEANKILFPSRKFTRNLTASDEHHAKIKHFQPLLKAWKENFERVKHSFSRPMVHVLSMEYEYARCYINSLGLQKVVESWVSMSTDESNGNTAHQSRLLRDLYQPNQQHIEEVSQSAQMILRSVVDGLAPGGNLRNAPVRTYLRSISGIMFTLKRFGVGGFSEDVSESLALLDQCTDLMERDVVDDVHLSSQIAGLIKLLVANIRKTFIRVQGNQNGSETASRQETPQQPTSQQNLIHSRDETSSSHQPVHKRQRTTRNAQRGRQSRDPLEGIQAQPLEDLSNQTFMPPPNFFSNGNGIDSSMAMEPHNDFAMDWLALPLDSLLNSSTGTVDQGFGGIGPTVGDRDMLELITNEHYEQWNMMPNYMGNNNMNGGPGGNGYYHQ